MLTHIVFWSWGFLFCALLCAVVWCCESKRRESKAKGKETRPKMKYEIEEHLAKFGGKADKGVKRICGNCHTEQIRQIGNAVCPKLAEALISAALPKQAQ